MKNITFTKIAIWAILALLIRLYFVDLPQIVNISRNLHDRSYNIDSIQNKYIIDIINKHNATVDYLKKLKEERK